MAGLLPPLKTVFVDANGLPLVGGKLFSYAAGTTTPLATYTDSTELGVNPNPVILDASGSANIWLTPVKYKFVLKNSSDVVLATIDQVSNLYDQSVNTFNLTDGSVTTVKLADNSVSTVKLQDSAITTQKLANSAITLAKIADANVTTAKIADANVTTAKIADANVTTAKIADASVTNAKIANATIDGSTKLVDGSVTLDKTYTTTANGNTAIAGSIPDTNAWNNMISYGFTAYRGKNALVNIAVQGNISQKLVSTGSGCLIRINMTGASNIAYVAVPSGTVAMNFTFLIPLKIVGALSYYETVEIDGICNAGTLTYPGFVIKVTNV